MIHDTDEYPFFYVALISDRNDIADARVRSAYVTPTPTIFIDGGYRNMMGGFPWNNGAGGPALVPYYEPEISASTLRTVPVLDMIAAVDWLDNYQIRVHVALGNGVSANTAPPTPAILSGGGQVPPLQERLFSVAATDPESNMVFYQWDWGDGEISDWLGAFNSGATAESSHSWAVEGEYQVRVKVRDPFGEESAWSAPASLKVSCCNGRVGDANAEGDYPDEVTLGDIMLLVDVKFISSDCSKLTCLAEADVNQDGGGEPTCDDHVTLGDIMYLVDYLFITGPENGTLPDCM